MPTNAREDRWDKLAGSLAAAQQSLERVLGFGATGAPPQDIDVSDALQASALALPGYSTLDDGIINELKDKTRKIAGYAEDRAAHRPLTFILTAEPGSGKSFFVNCMAKDCGMPMVNANVASLQTISELGYWIDEIRDHKTQDSTPVLLIDEADSKPLDIPSFLPLLWDGIFSWQGRSLKVGKCVIVLVVSNEALRQYIEDGREDHEIKNEFPKIEDLLSRINGGVIKLGSIDDRRLDKLCIALALTRRRFPEVMGVEIPFLKLLVNTRFLHSVRSMETLIQFFPPPGDDKKLRVTSEFEATLVDGFLKRETFRANVFAFHLAQSERVNAKQIWSEYRQARTMVLF